MLINRLKSEVLQEIEAGVKRAPLCYQHIIDDLEANDKVINLRLETIQYLVTFGKLKSSGDVQPLWYEIEKVYHLFE